MPPSERGVLGQAVRPNPCPPMYALPFLGLPPLPAGDGADRGRAMNCRTILVGALLCAPACDGGASGPRAAGNPPIRSSARTTTVGWLGAHVQPLAYRPNVVSGLVGLTERCFRGG